MQDAPGISGSDNQQGGDGLRDLQTRRTILLATRPTSCYLLGMDGIKTTYPYEATSPGVARHQCAECGAWERSDKGAGRLQHSKRCESRPQPATAAAAIAEESTRARRSELERFARQVRRTGLTRGRDADVAECVRLGLLSEAQAMNTDD